MDEYRMIQDIAPHTYVLDYENPVPGDGDTLLVYRRNELMVRTEDSGFLKAGVILWDNASLRDRLIYLFRIDDERFFTVPPEIKIEAPEGYGYVPVMMLRLMDPRVSAFAAATGAHLFTWYLMNRFCGQCGHPMIRSDKERALVCPDCHATVYPRINPSVIVGIIDREKDRMLVTEYNPNHISDPNNPNARRMQDRRHRHYALVAGYIEIGESGEDCVRREIMEEVGLRVKNITYFSSQPWAFSSSFLTGYVCELDGSDEILLQQDELSRAVWKTREEMEDRSKDISLTRAIIEAFRTGKI